MKWSAEDYSSHASFVFAKEDFVQPILSKLELQGHETVLDLGCGTGELTLDRLVPNAAYVLGVDSSSSMLAAAQAKLSSRDVSIQQKCTFKVADGQRLVEDLGREQLFDVCFSSAALHWMKEQESVLRGVYELLKPGGRFVFEMGGFLNCVGMRSELHRALIARGYPVMDPWYFPSVQQQRTLLEKTGFTVEYIELVPRITALDKEGLRGWMKTFCGGFLEVIKSQDERDALVEEICGNLATVRRLPVMLYSALIGEEQDMTASDGSECLMYTRLRARTFKR